MSVPGFTAEASLYQSPRPFHTAGFFVQNGSSSIYLTQIDSITKLSTDLIISPNCVEVWFPKYCYRVRRVWIDDTLKIYIENYVCGHEPCKICSDGTVSCP
jgi:hypothetical protein